MQKVSSCQHRRVKLSMALLGYRYGNEENYIETKYEIWERGTRLSCVGWRLVMCVHSLAFGTSGLSMIGASGQSDSDSNQNYGWNGKLRNNSNNGITFLSTTPTFIHFSCLRALFKCLFTVFSIVFSNASMFRSLSWPLGGDAEWMPECWCRQHSATMLLIPSYPDLLCLCPMSMFMK